MKDSVFPIAGQYVRVPDHDGVFYTGQIGLAKRELFAALCMARICRPSLTHDGVKLRAEIAVAHADALIKALNSTPKDGG